MLISACMIVKNEAAALPAALDSLQGRADEIVVVDTGSSDGTQGIAAARGARVLEVPWQDDFSFARNAALAAARGRYCLMVDADEQVWGDTWPRLRAFAEAGRFDLGVVVIVNDTADGEVRAPITRVCRRDERTRYSGRIHEQLVAPAGAALGQTGLWLRHSGYTEAALASGRKLARNLALLRRELADQPADPYLHFQIGRTLHRSDPAQAIEHFQAALRAAPAQAAYLPELVRDCAQCLKHSGRHGEARELVQTALQRFPDFTDLWFLEGLLCMELGQATQMLAAFRRCLELGEAPARYSTVAGVGSYRAHFNLGLFYELSGQREQARAHYTAALAAGPHLQQARQRLEQL